jgi:hypothetical protein
LLSGRGARRGYASQAWMSGWGQSRQFVCLPVTSGLSRSTDII